MPEHFRHLETIPGLANAFFLRQPSVDLSYDRGHVVAALRPIHDAGLRDMGFSPETLRLAEQVHGNNLCLVDRNSQELSPEVDGLMTSAHGIALGIYVADCAAVYIADKTGKGIALVHAGKKGAEFGIVPAAIQKMVTVFDSSPSDLLVQISPCIRPPDYEVDFAAEIREQCFLNGIAERNFVDCGVSTAAHLDKYYSYRAEKGLTGRMLAVLGWPLKFP